MLLSPKIWLLISTCFCVTPTPIQPVTGSQSFSRRYPYLPRATNNSLAQEFKGESGATSYNHNIPFKILSFTVEIYLDSFRCYELLVFK